MKFATIREINQKISQFLRLIEDENEQVIITRNGKPCAILTKLDEGDLEDYILMEKHRVEEIAENPGKLFSPDEVKRELGLQD